MFSCQELLQKSIQKQICNADVKTEKSSSGKYNAFCQKIIKLAAFKNALGFAWSSLSSALNLHRVKEYLNQILQNSIL